MKYHRSRRLLKKLHKRYLCDVRYSISISKRWRIRLFEAEDGTIYKIKRILCNTLQKLFQRYKLCFCVERRNIPDTNWVRFILDLLQK